MDNNIINALVTLLVGLVAVYVYLRQKSDNKRDAARSILLEVQFATRRIKSAKENPDATENTQLMTNESWSRYRQLFVNDFTPTEWDDISDFYEKCLQYDQAVINEVQSFPKNEEQIRINAHRVIADYVRDALDETTTEYDKNAGQVDTEKIREKFKAKADWFQQYYLNDGASFIPRPIYTAQKYKDDRIKFLNLISTSIPTNNIGKKLEKLSSRKWFRLGL